MCLFTLLYQFLIKTEYTRNDWTYLVNLSITFRTIKKYNQNHNTNLWHIIENKWLMCYYYIVY